MRIFMNKFFIVLLGTAILLSTALLLLNENAQAQGKVLFWGSRGQEVVVVQQKLKAWGFYRGFVDGKYGSATYRAVRDFQRKNGLRADGIVGPNTRAALGLGGTAAKAAPAKAKEPKTAAGFVSTSRDTQLLARLIEGEAADEPYSGKVAVGAVILNRIKSSAFPNTMAGVVYQPLAFESVSNGQYTRPLTQESIKAARQAMSGWDPTGGATFFWNPTKRVSPWIWSRSIITRIGDHVFAR